MADFKKKKYKPRCETISPPSASSETSVNRAESKLTPGSKISSSTETHQQPQFQYEHQKEFDLLLGERKKGSMTVPSILTLPSQLPMQSRPWGSLSFYVSKKIVYSRSLSGLDAIDISSDSVGCMLPDDFATLLGNKFQLFIKFHELEGHKKHNIF